MSKVAPPKKCPECGFTLGHAPECSYHTPKTLPEDERRYWDLGFALGDGDPAAGDRLLLRYRAHLASDELSLLKDPSLWDPE